MIDAMEITLRSLQKMVAMGTGSLMLLILRFHLGKKKKLKKKSLRPLLHVDRQDCHVRDSLAFVFDIYDTDHTISESDSGP